MLIPEFPKIIHYKNEADFIHCVQHVVCLEKIDGTNTRIGIPKDASCADDIVIGGRTLLENENGFSQDFLSVLIKKNADLSTKLIQFAKKLEQDVVLYGETCGGKIQAQGFIYGQRPHFLLFAACIDNIWVNYSRSVAISGEKSLPTLIQIAQEIQLEIAPCLYQGVPSKEEFDKLIERPSQHSVDQGFHRADIDNTTEGIVIWSDPIMLTSRGNVVFSKYKNPKRREYIESKSEADTPELFAKRTVLPERVLHAIQHLKEQGRWQSNMVQDQEATIRRVIQDISKEVDEYQDQLSKHGKKSVRQALTDKINHIFPQVVKENL